MKLKSTDDQLMAEAYDKVVNNQGQTKTAKFISTQKSGHLGNLSVYEMNPKLEQTGSEWFGIATGPDGKISLVDPDSEFMDSVEIPALQGVDLSKATPEMILSKLGYKVMDQGGQEHLPLK